MPPIRSMLTQDDLIQFTDMRGVTKTLLASQIPAAQNTVVKVETYINGTWIPANIPPEYQLRVHVLSISPLRCVIGAWDAGVTIPASWWNL